MFLVSSCSCLCPIQWSQVLSREWRCSWSSTDRRCSNYIWVIDNFIACYGASYIRDLTVFPMLCLEFCLVLHFANLHLPLKKYSFFAKIDARSYSMSLLTFQPMTVNWYTVECHFDAVQFVTILQSTPIISRLLGAKIHERELSGSPVISRCRAKATTREFRITDPHSQAFTTRKQYVER